LGFPATRRGEKKNWTKPRESWGFPAHAAGEKNGQVAGRVAPEGRVHAVKSALTAEGRACTGCATTEERACDASSEEECAQATR
jgi:hypothetical protein